MNGKNSSNVNRQAVAGTSPPTRRVQLTAVEIVQETWGEILGVAEVGAHDDFVDLGGNSLIVPAAMAKLSARVGLDLPARSLFEAPTPAEMAELIEEIRDNKPSGVGPIDGITPFIPEWVFPVRTRGAARPVWLFPGGMGGFWTLQRDAQVAALVRTDHPFYGFRRDLPHLDLHRADWIAAMATAYIEQMRAIQGGGPYLIYGICNGGALAWETAAQLLAMGEMVAGMLFYEVALDAEFAAPGREIPSPRPRQRGRMPPYLPQPLDVDLTLLMTEVWHARDRSAGWRQAARGRVETVVMPGDTPGAHNLYVNREAMIAGHLRDWISRSEARSGHA